MVYMRVTSRFSVKNGILYKRETVRPLDGAFPYKTFLSTPGLGGGIVNYMQVMLVHAMFKWF